MVQLGNNSKITEAETVLKIPGYEYYTISVKYSIDNIVYIISQKKCLPPVAFHCFHRAITLLSVFISLFAVCFDLFYIASGTGNIINLTFLESGKIKE